MCGVAGIFHYAEPDRPIDVDLLTRMTRAIAHRGPDDEGFHVDGPIGLGHRRLAIVDLTPTGKQPMASGHGAWISYNGELYNHATFRPRLEARGVTFRGTSDTETLLHLIAEYGPGALADTAGIFGLAYWDAARRKLVLARDPLGVKQIYYFDDGQRIVFASEIKAVLQCADVPRDPDPEAINQYLHFHTPLFDRTFFRHVKQVRAGEYLEINRHGATPRVYWQLDGFAPRSDDADAQVRELRELIGEVVGDQLMSDVPVGSFFSGGIDSSAVAAFAKQRGTRLRCFGVHFTDQGVIDEGTYQEQAAAALGLDLDLITFDGTNFADDLPRLMYFQDQPVIGAAMLPMWHVSKLAASRVKVCLGGQAADELFGGYARYSLSHPLKFVTSWLRGRRAPASPGGAQVGGNLGKQLRDPRTLRRLVGSGSQLLTWRSRYLSTMAKVPEARWRDIFADGIVSFDRARAIYEDTLDRSTATDPADKVMHWDLQTYLTGLFQQDDRMTMAHSLESRVPLADPRLVRFAFHTPFSLKVRAGASKWILRQAVSDVIPETVLNRRKVGFDTPAEAWMRGPHRGFLRDTLLSTKAKTRGLWNVAGLTRLLDDERAPLWFDVAWKALAIETWAQVFLDAA